MQAFVCKQSSFVPLTILLHLLMGHLHQVHMEVTVEPQGSVGGLLPSQIGQHDFSSVSQRLQSGAVGFGQGVFSGAAGCGAEPDEVAQKGQVGGG